MCELFGVSSREKTKINDFLWEFYSHSGAHPHGWGLAVFQNGMASIEKEPIRAEASIYLKRRLRHELFVRDAIAHIRLATKGNMEYENCHPFVRQDSSGRLWTLAHNGTMFRCPALEPYFYQQEGQTDSERILYYLTDCIDGRQEEAGRPLTERERFDAVDTAVCKIAEGNKVNLLIFDGECLYVHTNYASSLYYLKEEGGAYFSTRPLGKYQWKPLPMSTLCVWKAGEQVYTGTNHHYEYTDNPKDMEALFLDYSAL
ncbi:MAG: class II glutamine amidotransferase [Blautia sp.]|nr:class II glutamine amidotransferase [Blautia sp.]